MTLKVLGVGFGRTGTSSLKLALEMLGFGKCHHMREVSENPEQSAAFVAAAQGGIADWEKLYEGYQSCCDWPSCYFWRELIEYYPDAKVILSVRDSERWYRSMSETLIPALFKAIPDPSHPLSVISEKLVLEKEFAGNMVDKDHVIAVYERHNQLVRETVPAERLLEFDAKQGWEPLCNFLGVPVPKEQYPHANAKAEFKRQKGV